MADLVLLGNLLLKSAVQCLSLNKTLWLICANYSLQHNIHVRNVYEYVDVLCNIVLMLQTNFFISLQFLVLST